MVEIWQFFEIVEDFLNVTWFLGGDKHGFGNKGSGQRQNFMRLGYETGNTPFYLRFTYEPYYKGHQ